VVLRSGGEVLRLANPPYRSRFATFLQLRKELAQRCPRAAYFDLRFHSRIVAVESVTGDEMQTGAAAGTREARSGLTEVVRY